MAKETQARIRINKMLEGAGWMFFPNKNDPANICLETRVTIIRHQLDALGNDFEKTKSGFINFLLLDFKGFPVAVLLTDLLYDRIFFCGYGYSTLDVGEKQPHGFFDCVFTEEWLMRESKKNYKTFWDSTVNSVLSMNARKLCTTKTIIEDKS